MICPLFSQLFVSFPNQDSRYLHRVFSKMMGPKSTSHAAYESGLCSVYLTSFPLFRRNEVLPFRFFLRTLMKPPPYTPPPPQHHTHHPNPNPPTPHFPVSHISRGCLGCLLPSHFLHRFRPIKEFISPSRLIDDYTARFTLRCFGGCEIPQEHSLIFFAAEISPSFTFFWCIDEKFRPPNLPFCDDLPPPNHT